MQRLMYAGLCLAVAGCGGGEDRQAVPQGGSELTVTLPPTLPSDPAEANAVAAMTAEETPQAGFETIAAAAPPPKPATKAIAASTPAPEPEPAAAEADPPEVEVALAPASEPPASAAAGAQPAGSGNWGAYIRKARFACGRVQSIQPVERAGAGDGFRYYRVECDGGLAYQATDKRGHLYFRRWRG